MNIRYSSVGQLRILFREIFIEPSYFFRTERPHPLIVDCGSNIGMSVIFFKLLYPDARVLAFEPDPAPFELLEQNIRTNGMLVFLCIPMLSAEAAALSNCSSQQ